MPLESPTNAERDFTEILRSGRFYVFLAVMYFMSPKMLTTTVYYESIFPEPAAIKIEQIISAGKTENGDIETCLNVVRQHPHVSGHFRLLLPLARTIHQDNERNVALTTGEVSRASEVRATLSESALEAGCGLMKTGKIATVNVPMHTSLVRELPARSEDEVRLTVEGNTLVYASQAPLLSITYEATEMAPRQEADLYTASFEIMPPPREVRWWNLWMLLPAVAGDSVMGPLGWLLIISPRI